jgi:predicted CopG family antitoxin
MFINPLATISSMVSVLSYKKISVRRDVYEKLVELKEKQSFTSISDVISHLLAIGDIHATISSMLEKYHATLSSMIEKRLATIGSMTGETHATQGSKETKQYATKSSMEPKHHATQGSMKAKTTAWDILKRDKISCISNIKARNPSRVIETLFGSGAVKIDLGRDVCAVHPDFWWEFWNIIEKFKTPNDEENLKEFKDEKMKWLYNELRKEGILVFDSTRKPPAWTFDKRVEIPEKAFEATKEHEVQSTEEIEMEDAGEYEKYSEM